MAEPQAALNPEPADPQERAEHDLPPKSYAEAAQEATDNDSVQNGNDNKKVNGSSPQENGTAERAAQVTVNAGGKLNQERIVFERYSNGDGSVLTSVRPDPHYEEFLKHDRQVAPKKSAELSKTKPRRQDTPKSQLKSGRKAGEGWQQSAYVKNACIQTFVVTNNVPGFVGLLLMFLSSDAYKPWLCSGTLPR